MLLCRGISLGGLISADDIISKGLPGTNYQLTKAIEEVKHLEDQSAEDSVRRGGNGDICLWHRDGSAGDPVWVAGDPPAIEDRLVAAGKCVPFALCGNSAGDAHRWAGD